MSPQIFRTPRRRQTRQRSGFHVSGEKSGNEAIVIRAAKFLVDSSNIFFVLDNPETPCINQFGEKKCLIAIGGYIQGRCGS